MSNPHISISVSSRAEFGEVLKIVLGYEVPTMVDQLGHLVSIIRVDPRSGRILWGVDSGAEEGDVILSFEELRESPNRFHCLMELLK